MLISFPRYFTDKKVQSGDLPSESCPQRVLDERERIRANASVTLGVVPTVGLGAAMLIFVLVGTFAAGIAQAFQLVRKYVYHDADNLDTAFDAGGKVSIGLTATTIVSQWTWSATLLQSSTVASKYGISGPYWYAGGATIQIILFAILSIMLKTRAPGAKTFLQVRELAVGHRGQRTSRIYTRCIVTVGVSFWTSSPLHLRPFSFPCCICKFQTLKMVYCRRQLSD